MPNWCYNELDVEFDNDLCDKIYNNRIMILKKTIIPEDLIKNIVSYLPIFQDEESQIADFVECCKDLGIAKDDSNYCDSGSFGFESGWGPPIDLLSEASEDFPLLIINDEYEETNSNFAGIVKIQNGKVIEQKEYDLDEMLWDQNGGSYCGKDILDYLLNEDEIELDINNENKIITFNNLEEIKKFYNKYPDANDIIRVAIQDYLIEYTLDNNIENCEDEVMKEFKKILK